MWFIINHVLRRSKSNQSDMACGKVTFSRFSFFWVFSCAFCVGLLWSPPVYCVEVASLLCRSRWFTVLKSPVYCVEVTLVYRRFTVLKSLVYCVEVAVLPCRNRRFTVLKSSVYCVEVAVLPCRSRCWFTSAWNQTKTKTGSVKRED